MTDSPAAGLGRQPPDGGQPRRRSRQPGLPGRRPGPGPAADRPGRRPGPLPCRALAAAPGADRRPAADPGRPGRARRRRPPEGGQAPRRRPPARPPHASHLGRRPGRLPACPACLPRSRARSPGVRLAPALHGEPTGGPSRRGRAAAGNLCAGRPGVFATIVAIVTSSQLCTATRANSGGGQPVVIDAVLKRSTSWTSTRSGNRGARCGHQCPGSRHRPGTLPVARFPWHQPEPTVERASSTGTGDRLAVEAKNNVSPALHSGQNQPLAAPLGDSRHPSLTGVTTSSTRPASQDSLARAGLTAPPCAIRPNRASPEAGLEPDR